MTFGDAGGRRRSWRLSLRLGLGPDVLAVDHAKSVLHSRKMLIGMFARHCV